MERYLQTQRVWRVVGVHLVINTTKCTIIGERIKSLKKFISEGAFADEDAAYAKIKKKLGKSAKVFQKPAGADAGFPDYGFTVTLDNGDKIDLHIEYKNSHTAQMGSMRDWRFDGKEFYTPDTKSEQKDELITLMNATPKAKANAKRILQDLKKYFSKDVKEISSGSLSVIKDKIARYIATKRFAENTRDYQIAAIIDTAMGDRILTHYKKKFAKSRVTSRAKGHIIMMQIRNDIWIVQKSGRVNKAELMEIATKMGATGPFSELKGLTAQLEVRIQPRGLTSKGSKPTSIDVMASFRLKGAPKGGTKLP